MFSSTNSTLDPHLELQQKAAALEEALKNLREENHRTKFRAAIDTALTHPESLRQILKRCTDAVVHYLDAAFARIWTLNEAENVLELQASSGLYTHIDGDHRAVPVGKFKIGWIAETRQPHITNAVQTDPRVGDKAWAKREGMKAFAGYPLVIEDQLVGVLAMFAYEELGDLTLQALQVVAQQLALGIKRKQVEDALRVSETQLRQQTQQLEQTLHELQATQIQIIQSEKRSALGDLVAGVAHEISNPLGFLAGNIQPALEYVNDLFDLLDLYQSKLPDPGQEIAAKMSAIDLGFIRQDLPSLIVSMREGINRIRGISTSLRIFSRADQDHKIPFNIHDGIDSSLMILKYRLTENGEYSKIKIIKAYGNLPLIECFPGQLNQVFMNLLANAIDAIVDSNSRSDIDQITITTLIENKNAVISIQDTGDGMSEETKQRIFEHLFTTKPVGQGTGLGLSIARQIVVEKHGGELRVNSELGKGAEFVIQIPL